jgi:hypothetical protein
MSDLSNRTARALADNDALAYAALLREWLNEAPLLGNLYRSRAMCGRLFEDQKGMLGALAVFVQQADRFPDDGPMQTFKDIALKQINTAACRETA